MLQWTLFLLVTGYAIFLFCKAVYHRYLYMKLGRPVEFRARSRLSWSSLSEFFGQVFGQRKLLKDWRSGIMHIVIFYGFIILQFGAIDLIIKGLTQGGHLPLPAYDLFGLSQEITVLLILIAVGYAAYRRYGERIPRLKKGWKPSLVLMLISSIMLTVLLSLSLERIWFQLDPTVYAPISSLLSLALNHLSTATAEVLFYLFWWLHLLILLFFLVYIPQSKHFHLITAPINIWLRRTESPGRLSSLDLEDEEAESFGAGAITDFSRKQMLDFYACVECGRCTNMCPASNTGKALSPMHLITKLRDHLTDVGARQTGKSPWQPTFAFASAQGVTHRLNERKDSPVGWPDSELPLDSGDAGVAMLQMSAGTEELTAKPVSQGSQGGAVTAEHPITDIRPTLDWQYAAWGTQEQGQADYAAAAELELIGDVMTEAEIWACTTCRNCEDQCPVGNEHVDKIIDLRRHLVLMQGSIPQEGQRALQNIERQGNPWGISRNERVQWTAEIEGLSVPTVHDNPDFEYLFFVGSMGSYDLRSRKISRSFARLMLEAGINFAILGNEEKNSGDTPRRMGNEFLFQQLCQENIALFQQYGVRKIVTADPHAFNTFKNEYPEFGLADVEVIHHTQLLERLVKEGKLVLRHEVRERMTYHDSCYLGRYNGIYDAPREILRRIPGMELAEMERSREDAMCCGAGGGLMWMEETSGKRINVARTEQALEVSPTMIGSGCPYCLTMLEDGVKMKELEVKTKDVAEILELSVFGTAMT